MSDYFMKTMCKDCPFSRKKTPFLTDERATELAYHTENPYNDFPCHKTTVEDEESEEGEMLWTENSKTCAGFLSMQINAGADCPDGFTPSPDAYEDAWEMIGAYEEENSKK